MIKNKKNVIKKFNFKKQYLINNLMYMDTKYIVKTICQIIAIFGLKGLGKTVKLIRLFLIDFIKLGYINMYIRLTKEQIKNFAQPDKVFNLFRDLGFIGPATMEVNQTGVYYKKNKIGKIRKEAIIYFVAASEAMNIQSSTFDSKKIHYILIDEVQNHFQDEGANTTNKLLNVVASTIRNNNNVKIIFLSNMVNPNTNIFLQIFNLQNEFDKIPLGNFRKFQRSKFVIDSYGNKKYINLMIGIYRPKPTQLFMNELEKSLSYKLSYFANNNYGSVINSSKFAVNNQEIPLIKKLKNYKYTFIINGLKIGLWEYINNKEQTIYQFSSKYNKTGKNLYHSKKDYIKYGIFIDNDRLKSLENKLISHELEFENYIIFEIIINLITGFY